MIIIEGTDKAGKSTLLSNLVRFFPSEKQKNLKILHFGLLPDDWDYHNDYLRFVKPNIILDRFIDSELAYGPVYRNKIKTRRIDLENIYRKCSEIGALTIYCNPNIEEVIKRIDAEGDMTIKKKEQLEALRKNFDKIFNKKYPLELEIIDTTQRIPDNIYKRIVDKSLVLERNAENINGLNYRGYTPPSSQYIVYTNEYEIVDQIYYLINKFSDLPMSYFSVISSRNTDNKPVNIASLVMALPVIKKIFTIGENVELDYNNAENKNAHEYCISHEHFVKQLQIINKQIK